MSAYWSTLFAGAFDGRDRHRPAEVYALLERARFDLERGWIAAAQDCLDRAMRLLRDLEAA